MSASAPSRSTARDPQPRRLAISRHALAVEGHALADVELVGYALGPQLGTAPIVLVAGGITASPFPFTGADAWWPALAADDLIDPDRHTVLTLSWPGTGSTWRGFAETAPPPLSAGGLADLIAAWLDGLGVTTPVTYVGACLGAMVGIALAVRHPHRVARLIAISAGLRSDGWGTAVRHLQRELVRDGLRRGDVAAGMTRARQVGMLTYRGRDEFDQRFGVLSPELDRPPVAAYLDHHGRGFAARFPPHAYLLLSEATDRCQLRDRAALARVTAEVVVVGVPGDLLFPFELQQEMHRELEAAGATASLWRFESQSGHDAFLADQARLADLLRDTAWFATRGRPYAAGVVAEGQPVRPGLAMAGSATRRLHQPLAANAPYLHPERRSLQRDLGSSAEVHAWQSAKAARVAGAGPWSELPLIYARYGNPGARALIAELRALEHARCALVTDSGMQAIALAVDALVGPGTHAVIMRQVYNKTRAFLELTSARVGASLTLVDDGDHTALAAALRPETRLVLAETYTNPLMRAQDVAKLIDLVGRAPDARLVIDSTIATPWGLRAPLLESGVAVVVGSLTKALGGEDAVLGGYLAMNDVALANQIMDLLAMRGGILDDDRATRIAGGLARAEAMHARRCESATRVAAFLAAHPRVERVFHPSRPDHPDAAVIARDYTRHGSLFSFRVRGLDEDGHGELADRIASCGIIRYAFSFDGLVTKVNHHRTVSEYRTPAELVERLGIDRLIRLAVGLEDADDLIACLAWSLA